MLFRRIIWGGLLLAPLMLKSQVQFTDAAGARGVVHTYGEWTPTGGVSFCDFDGDGRDDLTLATADGNSIEFFKNTGNGFQAVDFNLTEGSDPSTHILWVDYDNDGDKDLFVANRGKPDRLYRRDGAMVLTDITAQAGLPVANLVTYGAAFGDYDRDGWLDLYLTQRKTGLFPEEVSNHLYRNTGQGTFEEKTLFAGVADSSKAPWCTGFVDIDRDLWPDIYNAQDRFELNTLYYNRGDGTFADISVSSGADLGMNAMSVTAGDYDNNGYLDIYITNTAIGNKLLRNNGDTTFTEVADSLGLSFNSVGWGAVFFDLDNDADLDLYVSGMEPGAGPHLSSACYENLGNGTFALQTQMGFAGDTVASFANAWGDVNQDGFPDVMVVNRLPFLSQLWENSGNSHNWTKISLEGVQSNRDAIGTWIEVYSGGSSQVRYTQCGNGFLGQNSSMEIIGLGTELMVDSLIVQWPSGHIDRFQGLPANQILYVREGVGLVSRTEPLSASPGISLFPNPASDEIRLSAPELAGHEIELVWRNLAGRQLRRDKLDFNGSQRLSSIDLPKGLYLLELRDLTVSKSYTLRLILTI